MKPGSGVRAAFAGPCASCDFHVDQDEGVISRKTRASLKEAVARFPDAALFMKMDLDTLVFPENLLWLLGKDLRVDGARPAAGKTRAQG